MSNVLITHAQQYTGPGAISVMLREGNHLLCHDAGFADAATARAFEKTHAGAIALKGQTPEELAAEISEHGVTIDAVVCNDVYPNTPQAIEDVPMETLRNSFEALLAFPFRLAQLLLPAMKRDKKGRFVFVTSARYLQPENGFSVATSLRAGTTAFATALAKEVAAFGIQVNVVAPNYLYSETYYPKARFIDDPVGRVQIAAKVPMGRLGEPEEVGELIAFL
ncbi:MAG: SDR family oxidoreductase, partial [Burkholderiaceae bacterium]